MSLSELAERCEQATGPDRELDKAIADAVLGPVKAPFVRGKCERYTASLDAAMTLVSASLELQLTVSPGGKGALAILLPERPNNFVGHGKAPALALCAAALRARDASGMEAATAGETGTGSTEGESAVAKPDAQSPSLTCMKRVMA